MKWVSLNTDLWPLLFLLLSSDGDDLCQSVSEHPGVCVERGSAGSWWSIWTGVWIWILSSSLKSLNWLQTEQLSLDFVESALYRCVVHELFDAEKIINRCYKSDSDPGPIFIKRLRITLRVTEDENSFMNQKRIYSDFQQEKDYSWERVRRRCFTTVRAAK